jgi:glycerate 2-kinase
VKQTAQRIFRETLAALDARAAMKRKLVRNGPRVQIGVAAGSSVDLREFTHILAIAFGKASLAMAEALTEILAPEFAVEGILVVPASPTHEPSGWTTFVGGHPLPNEASFAAGRAILERLAACDERTLVFFLLSGGGSALVESPIDARATLEDFRALNQALVTCGAPIAEINCVRKHLSAVKGGRMADAAARSVKITLAISDVPIGEESALASGPTLPDPTTVRDADEIIGRYNLLAKLPTSIRSVFEEHRLPETPKEGDAAFERGRFELVLGAHDLTHAAHRACEGAGYVCLCDSSTDDWPVEKAAAHLLALLEAQRAANRGKPVAVIADGEVSSPVTGDGVGGRNAAFVLACVERIAGKNITVLSAGTDGIDGNSPAAGAVADGESLAHARAAGLDPREYFRGSDAYHFFAALGDAIVTGPTGSNLRDLRVLLAS